MNYCSEKAIGVDIDNVIASTDKKVRELIEIHFGLYSSQSDITNWRYSQSLPISNEQEEFIFSQLHSSHLQEIDLLPHSQQALLELREIFPIFMITSRPSFTKYDTEAWLNKYHLPFDQLHFLKDKTILAPKFEYVVEDRGDTAQDFANNNVDVFLFDYPWNKTIQHPNIVRVSGWRDVINRIKKQLTLRCKENNRSGYLRT